MIAPPGPAAANPRAPAAHPQLLGAQFDTCCEGRLLGREHSRNCDRRLAEQLDRGLNGNATDRDAELALALQAAELRQAEETRAAQAQARAEQQDAMCYVLTDPLWGDLVKDKEPGLATRVCFTSCPCFLIGCSSAAGARAWRQFLCSFSTLLAALQVIYLTAVIIASGGIVSIEDNPMLGPHYHALDPAGAKNAARVLKKGEWWRLGSAIMLHAGWLHLAGNLIVQLRTGCVLELMWGRWVWLLIYVTTGAFANLASSVLHPDRLGVGSSGALCGLIGAWLSFILITWNQTMPGDVKARNAQTASIVFSILFIIVFSFLPLMDFAAHVGGLVMGAGMAMIIFGVRLQHLGFRWATIASGIVLVLGISSFTLYKFVAETDATEHLLDLCQPPNC
eukprot:TRINITY_DN94689_c0_g1_i1.p1 TRINITY_DN94689_c0_g1~~TRINITY_DN94689_c0_g1_i1.p1  ORF type:complete len:401 (+),score=60.06 TRINITY_DN94689_c0_g1_i1:23-1204(+)